MREDSHSTAIAITGMACQYPGAKDLRNFWENILAKRRQFRPFPDIRLPLSDYYDPDPDTPDKTYCNKAALIDGFKFDWAGHRIPKSTIDSTDIAHWLALEVAIRSLKDAGFNRENVPIEKSGVILGNTLTGEQTRAEGLRLRWPFIKRTLETAAKTKGLSQQTISDLLQTMEVYYKSIFAPVTEDTLSGGLSNTISGRICNYLDFHGGGYTVDGACSSSLLAIATAATALTNGDLDLAMAGGVDISLDAFEMIGFAKTAALTKKDMRVYDRRASGFIPGEGCGFVVLKRLEDAIADGNYIYAVLRGWGISSDGKGGLTAPSVKGQAAALQRAYERAGYTPGDLDFIEGHGTGTVVGDKTELEAISLAMGDIKKTDLRHCGITSLKSIIGHTKAASGIGGFIKAAIAVNRRILPPTANCSEPNEVFESSVPSVYPIMSGEIRLPEEKLKAGVSAMGFGGINCHVTIESGDQPSESLVPSIEERKLLVSHQETELFVLSASSASELLKRTQTIKQRAQGLPESELVDLAAQITNELEPNVPVRSAVIAGTPEKLSECLQNLEKMLVENPPLEGETVISPQQDIFIGNTVQKSRVGFLFPGQGSQFLNMGKALVERHEWAQKLLANAAIWIEKNGSKDIAQFIFRPTDRAINVNNIKQWSSLLKQTEIAQPAICLSSLLWIHKLARLGIRPVVAGGHSLGELTAFHAAGAFDESALLKLASTRGKAMAAPGDERGIMASLGCSQESAIDVLNRVKGYAVIANINSTRQIVISGERTGVEEAVNIAKGKGIRTHILAVSNAFHSRFVSSAAERLRNIAPIPKKLASTKTKLISGMNGREIKEGINLQDHFADQVLSQVDFVSLVKKMAKDCDLMLEVGPGRVLSDLANTIIQDDNIMCRPTESKQGKDRDLNVFLGNFFVHGGNVKWEALYRDRFVRPFVPSSERIFIENPCERPYKVPDTEHLTFSGDRGLLGAALADKINISPQELTDYLSSRHQFIEAVIKADMENMPSATLTSLSRQDNLESVDTITKEKQTEKIEDISRDTTSTSGLLFELVEKRTGFPKDSLSAELRLLDDLNLDSIKAAELIAEASMRLGVAGETDVSKYANATLKEIADVFDQLKKDRSVPAESVSAAEVKTDKPSWVRNFVVKPVVQELSPVDLKGEANNWKESKVLILSEPEEQSIARTLSKQLINHGAEVYTALFEDIRIQGLSGNDKYTGYIAILPRASNQVGLNSSRLESIIDRLRTIALLPSDTENNESRETVAYIQFGGGYFGTEPEVSGIEQCTTLALAASLHLERPDLKVRVLDFSTEIQTAQLAGKIIEELSTSDNYAAAGYDKKLTRRVPKPYLSEPVDYKPRPVSWSSDDVILITGGAKGITAECSLSLAQTTNVRVALIGSSPHPGENSDNGGEIAQTLKRFGDSGLTAKYYQCDIVNPGAVDSVVKRIQKELGDIGGVIHGSALNKPGNLDKVSTEDALKEVAPKVLGTVNLCNALKDSPPKLFAGFSSIIGISGMIRNAWYGFSNEALNLLLCRFAKEHPETSVLSIAFSIWDDVGMGVRMGSTKYLAQMGIGAIPAKEGVRRFLQLIMNDPGEKQVIVAARIANLDTLQPHLFPLPKSSRFLEKIIYYYPKVEIISRAHLSLDRDTYIKDHLWRGTYLFPTVFGLEAMSQAVAYVTGENNFNSICIEDISLERPIPVNPESGVEIEIRAEVLERKTKKENRRVRVGISTAQTGFAVDHFSALFILKVDQEAPQEKVELPRAPLEIQPDKDLYNGKLLFQGPQFQRIKQIYSLDSKKCVFRSKITFFKEHKSDDAAHSWLLGDPFFRDSLLHSAQIAIPRDICLPLKIESIERYHVEGNLPGSLIGIAIIEDLIDRDYLVTVSAINENGKVVERLKGYILRILEHHEDYPAAEEIANPGTRDERIIREEIKKRAESLGLLLPEISSDYLPGLHQLTKNERHKKELPVVHEAIKRTQQIRDDVTKERPVKWLQSGKPSLEGTKSNDIDISLSHDDNTLLCVAGSGSQGCDIAPISKRNQQEWIALLGSEKKHLLQQLPESGDHLDHAGTRIWAATEAFRKATNSPDPALTIEMHTDDTVVFRSKTSNRNLHALTFPVKLTRNPKKIIAIVAHSSREKKPGNPPVAESIKNVHMKKMNFDLDSYKADIVNGPQGQPVFIFRFPVTFKEAANPGRSLYFSHYFAWIGKLREFMIHPVYEELVKWFSTGKWGMVTNHAETKIFGEAISGDVIEGRLWLDNISGSEKSKTEFCFEWRKLNPEGINELIAISKTSTTWVAIKGHGVVEVQPFPEFAQEFVNKLLPHRDYGETHYNPPSITQVDRGKKLYSEPSVPVQTLSLLQEQIFETTLEDANLVGNIYFSNYYIWQGRVRDNFLNKVIPEYFSGSGKQGGLRCVNCKVNHMSEAMPFDRIVVRMHRRDVYERGLIFYFDYYRITADGKRHKLGYGEHEAVWYAPDKSGKWGPTELPLALRSAIIPNDKPINSSSAPLRQSGNDDNYDVIVIGSGIGGLAAAALLAKSDRRVLVVEQHDKAGGFCSSWERYVKHKNGKLRFVFDAGVHDIAAVGDNRRIPYLLRELDVQNRIEWLRMSHEYFFPDFKLKIPNRVKDYIEELCKHFPDERDGLAAFFKEAEICFREFYSLFDIKPAERNKKIQKSHFFRWSNLSLMDMIGKYTRNPQLKQVLSMIAHYLTDDPTALNASVGIPLYAYYFDGGYYPRGSSQVLSNTLVDAINRHGSTVKLRNAVSRILIKDRHVRGVQLANGKVFNADTVVSNADIRLTFLKLIGREHLPASFSRQIENLRPSNSSFMVFLGVDFIPDTNPITYIKDEAGVTAIMIPSKVDPSLAPPGYACVTLGRLIPHEQAVTWDRGKPGYSKRKQQFGDQLIAFAEKAIPGLKDHIIYRQEASPATFARYAWTTDGAIYALAIKEWRPPIKTSIKGLYLAGAGTAARPGVEDAVYTGIMAAEAIIKEKQKILKKK